MGHDSTSGNDMHFLKWPAREGNEAPLDHSWENQRALTCMSSSFFWLSITVYKKNFAQLQFSLREHLPSLRHFVSIFQCFSVIPRERERESGMKMNSVQRFALFQKKDLARMKRWVKCFVETDWRFYKNRWQKLFLMIFRHNNFRSYY